MKKTISLLLLASFLVACKLDKDKLSATQFPETIEIKAREIVGNGVLVDPMHIVLLDQSYIINDEKSESILHFFAINDHSHLGSFIGRGKGPKEEILIQTISRLSGNRFYYKGLGDIKTLEFNFSEKDLVYLEKYDVSMDALVVGYPFDKSKVLGWNYSNHQKEFLVYNTLEDTFSDFGAGFFRRRPTLNLEENHRIYGNKEITVKPDGKSFATVYMSLPLIRIFNTSDGQLVSETITQEIESFPHTLINRHATQDDIKKLIENYYKIVSTDHFIYALYSGKTKGELYPDLFSPNFSPPDFGNEIHVFDWMGKPVKKILLDRMIFSFDVSSHGTFLMALTRSEPDKILRFELN